MRKKIPIIFLMIFMLPLLCSGQTVSRVQNKMSFDFIDADIRNVLRGLAEVSGKNIVIAEDIKGKVTIKLDNVSWDEALDVIIKTNKIEKIEEDNIIRIITFTQYEEERKRKTEKRAEYLKEKQEKLKTREDFIAETIFLNFAKATEFEKVVKSIYQDIQVTVVESTNALIVYSTKEKIEEIRKKIKEHDIRPAMVQIEARIVQANSNFTRDLGIQWGASYATKVGGRDIQVTGGKNYGTTSGATSYSATTGQVGVRGSTDFPYGVNLPAAVGAKSGGALGIFLGSVTDSFMLDVQLTALESDGKGKIISHPKIVTADNKKAIITQGKSVPYATVSQSGTQTQFADAVLSLEVTPQVTKDGNIRLQIKATKNAPDFANNTIAGPPIDKKEATTEVIIRDGETIVIGGIYESDESESGSGIPFLRKIPVLGWLFEHDLTTKTKTELLIFITPTILKNLYAEEG
jgi:type IV pilus assembly protein PilQ